MKKVKAILLFSGGLDSILAAKILQEQKVEILALSFESHFFSAEFAKKAAKKLKIPLIVIDISKDLIKILKKPKHGFGSQMNPCIDCHILMLKKARDIMKRKKFDFVASGDVLNERPFSQNKKSLKIIEKESLLDGYLLRPLSAKKLEPTIPEKKGLINREKLLDISGRRRKKQIELAKKFGIFWYPSPAGGCLLTDPEFSKRLKDLISRKKDFDGNDVELLKIGRHFWFNNLKSQVKRDFSKKIKIVVGRNHKENLKLKKIAKKNDILIEMINYPGPTTLIRNYSKSKVKDNIIQKAKILIINYSNKAKDKKDIEFKIQKK